MVAGHGVTATQPRYLEPGAVPNLAVELCPEGEGEHPEGEELVQLHEGPPGYTLVPGTGEPLGSKGVDLLQG